MCIESGLIGCSGRGECSELTGQPLCFCNVGYIGDKCQLCDSEVNNQPTIYISINHCLNFHTFCIHIIYF